MEDSDSSLSRPRGQEILLGRNCEELETRERITISDHLSDHSYVRINSEVTVKVFCGTKRVLGNDSLNVSVSSAFKLNCSSRQDSLDCLCVKNNVVPPVSDDVQQREIDGVTEDGYDAVRLSDHPVDHSVICSKSGAATSEERSGAISSKNLTFQPKLQDQAVPSATMHKSGRTHCHIGAVTPKEKADRERGWDERCLLSGSKESGQSVEDAVEQLYSSLMEGSGNDTSPSASCESEWSQGCGSKDDFETVDLPGHLTDHSYVFHTRLLCSKQAASDPVLAEKGTCDKTRNMADNCDTAEGRDSVNCPASVQTTVSFSPVEGQNSEHSHQESSQVSSSTQLSSGKTGQGYNCEKNVFEVLHVPDHLVDHSYLNMDSRHASDAGLSGVTASDKADVEVSNQLIRVREPDGTVQIITSQNDSNILGIVSGNRQTCSPGNSMSTHRSSESSPKDYGTEASPSLPDDAEHGCICRQKDEFESVLSTAQLDHSYICLPTSTTLNVGENAEVKDNIDHENLETSNSGRGTNQQDPLRSDQCRRNELMRILQRSVCEDFNMVSSHDVQHGSTRKRPRKVACPRSYAPRNVDMESRLPPGTVDCIDIVVDAIPHHSKPKFQRRSDIHAPGGNANDYQNHQSGSPNQADELRKISDHMLTTASRQNEGEAALDCVTRKIRLVQKWVPPSVLSVREEALGEIQKQAQ